MQQIPVNLLNATFHNLRLEVPAWLTFCNIQIEEVTVEHGLDHAGDDGDEVEEALEVVAPNPVDQVQGTVQTQEEKIVSGDGLCFPSFADHKKLRENSNWFKIDGEGPQYLKGKNTKIYSTVLLITAGQKIFDLAWLFTL